MEKEREREINGRTQNKMSLKIKATKEKSWNREY
jgi:hypothetical protein